jgi:hypothetical protein
MEKDGMSVVGTSFSLSHEVKKRGISDRVYVTYFILEKICSQR